MSRSGYSDSCDGVTLYRGAVISAVRGKRGRALLLELAAALDAMPVKELIADELEANGGFCALGVVGAKRGLNLKEIDPEEAETVAKKFGIAQCLAREIVWVNDEAGPYGETETPAQRWIRVRKWVQDALDDPRSVY